MDDAEKKRVAEVGLSLFKGALVRHVLDSDEVCWRLAKKNNGAHAL